MKHKTRRRHSRGSHGRTLVVVSRAVAAGAPIAHVWGCDPTCPADSLIAVDADWPVDDAGYPIPEEDDRYTVVCLHCLAEVHPVNRHALTEARRVGYWSSRPARS